MEDRRASSPVAAPASESSSTAESQVHSPGQDGGPPPEDGIEHPLRDIAAAFQALLRDLKGKKGDELGAAGALGLKQQQQQQHEHQETQQQELPRRELDLRLFVFACERLNVIFSLLGTAFAFAGKDFIDKVKDLKGVCSEFPTAEAMLAEDVAQDRVKVRGSHSRNLLRVKWGLDFNQRLLQHLLEDSNHTLRSAAGHAYEEVFHTHHSWAIRSLVSAGLLALPSTDQFLGKLHEDGMSCREPAQEFVRSVVPVIKHVEEMFVSRGLGIDW